MATRRRRGGIGLRARIVGAVLITTVASLAVAAAALQLGPLENSLRNAVSTGLHSTLRNPAIVSELSRLKLVATTPLKRAEIRTDIRNEIARLGQRLDASVYLFGYPGVSGTFNAVLPHPPYAAIKGDTFADVKRAFQATKSSYPRIASIGGVDYARAAVYFTTKDTSSTDVPHQTVTNTFQWVLAVRKPIEGVSSAVHAVRTAFLDAILAGLALTLLIGIPLAFRVVRRLRRLRQAALELAEGGPGATEVELDRGRDEVGDLARAFGVMQQRLGHQEQARRAFVATASHELRTPLASLDGMLELLADDLREGDPDLEDARALLERARAQSRRLGRLAADLLDLSRIDAEVTLRSEPVELGELSRAVLAEFELGATERRIDATLEAASGQVWALGDPGSVARILRILLDNAVRATPDGEEVRVELRGDQSGVELSVCDGGPGVPPAERAVIFERFQRGRDTGGRGGFGLGLAIGRELAERMGGSLTLDAEYAPGAKFTLKLPAAKAPDHDALAVL